jgi:hypothetical protein
MMKKATEKTRLANYSQKVTFFNPSYAFIGRMSLMLMFLFYTSLQGYSKETADNKQTINSVVGVYALLKRNAPVPRKIFSSPHIIGVSVRIGWKDIEPVEGDINWDYFERYITTAKSTDKKLMLRVIAGALTPVWVYTAGAEKFEYMDQNPYHRKTYRQTMYMPIPWDEVYLEKWIGFIKAFGRKYNKEQTISLIHMTGPSKGGEMYLANKRNRKAWRDAGYSKTKLVKAWKRVIDAYAEAFPDKPLAIAIANPLYQDGTVERIIAYGLQRLGTRFCIQGNWLAAKTNPKFPLCMLIQKCSEKTTVGFQMLWSISNDSGQRMGGTLRRAIDNGLSAGAHYFEIYAVDIRNPKLMDDLIYATDRLLKK